MTADEGCAPHWPRPTPGPRRLWVRSTGCARDAAPSKGHLRAHHAGSQVEGSDAVYPPRPMRAPSYPCQCRPTGAVGAQLGPLSCAGAAVQVDNPSSPGCDHVRHHLARHQQRAADVCGDDRPPLVTVVSPCNNTTMTNAALYLRISLDNTGEHLAVDRQREDCRRIATERGWTIVEEYVDNSVSASKRATKRPAYDRMVTDFAAGHFDALVCWDLDRLTRQPRQLEDWIDAAEERGLLLTTANGEADLSTDGGRLFARIKASVARAEVESKSARQKRAAAQRADRGKPPSGARLTGYTDGGQIVADEALVVRSMFTRFSAGDSLRGITVWLTEQGVQTRFGKPWGPTSVRRILTNPRYAGRAIYCGKTTGKAGQWDAIVGEAAFDAVQARLTDPRRITNRVGTDRKHLGSGIYLCGVCGGPLCTHSGGRYRCRAGGHVTRMGESIDVFVRGVIRARLARADVADLLTVPDTDAAKALTAQIGGLRARLGKIEADYDADLIDGRRFAVATEKVQAELTRAETTRARVAGGEGLASVLTAPDPVAAFDSAPLGAQRAILAALATVTLLPAPRGHKFDPETVRVEPVQP